MMRGGAQRGEGENGGTGGSPSGKKRLAEAERGGHRGICLVRSYSGTQFKMDAKLKKMEAKLNPEEEDEQAAKARRRREQVLFPVRVSHFAP